MIIRGLQRVLAHLKTSTRTEGIYLRLVSRRFYRLNRNYLQLSIELLDYQNILRYYFSILANFYSLLIVYAAYLTFLDQPPFAIILYCFSCLICLVVALLMLLRCSLVNTYHGQISKLALQYQHYLQRQRYAGLGSVHQHLKVDCMVLALDGTQLAFRALDGKIVDSYLALQILFNIIKYFFLLFMY